MNKKIIDMTTEEITGMIRNGLYEAMKAVNPEIAEDYKKGWDKK